MKKTLILIITYLLTFSIFGIEFKKVEMNDLNFSFKDQQGEARFNSAFYQTDKFSFGMGQSEILLQRNENRLSLYHGDLEFTLNLTTDGMINSINEIHLQNIDFEILPNELFNLNLTRVYAHIGNGMQEFNNIAIECHIKNSRNKNEYISYLLPCFENGFVSIPRLNLDQLSQFTVTNALNPEDNTTESLKDLKDIKLIIKDKKFLLSLKTKIVFNFTVKAEGYARYIKDESSIHLKLEKAKAGIFSVKSKILKEIKEANLKNVKVIGDNIIIQI